MLWGPWNSGSLFGKMVSASQQYLYISAVKGCISTRHVQECVGREV